jgi:ribose transport system ATP-binding protein
MGFEVRQLSKTYGGVAVLKDVDLAVADGEIHALLGANGAGKSTLIKCISGGVAPDSGELVINGEPQAFLTPRQARLAGIAIIYQDYSLASTLTVAENIFLGEEIRWGPFIRRQAQRRRAKELLEQIGAVSIDPGQRVIGLGGADQQVVEIAKSLKTDPSLLLLDEPTASLTEAEVGRLMSHLRRLRERGLPIVYVTHRLGEIFQIADRVTVLRDGQVVLSAEVSEISRQTLVEAITGRRQEKTSPRMFSSGDSRPTEWLLETRNLVAPGIGPISFGLRTGETLGVFGLVGSGRTELLETLFGARRLARGSVLLGGHEVHFCSAADAISAGVALVPSERLRNSLFAPLSGLENVLLPRLGEFAAGRLLRGISGERRAFATVAERLQLQPPRGNMQANRYSGGNQQKLVLGRWLGRTDSLRVLLLDEPTQGVDVGARQDLYGAIKELASRSDCGVIFTSSDEEEIEAIADRVLILSRGLLVGELVGAEIDQRELLHRAHLGEREAS